MRDLVELAVVYAQSPCVIFLDKSTGELYYVWRLPLLSGLGAESVALPLFPFLLSIPDGLAWLAEPVITYVEHVLPSQ